MVFFRVYCICCLYHFLGLVGTDSSEDSSIRTANGTSDSQAVAAQMLAGSAASRFGYYLVPGPGKNMLCSLLLIFCMYK